MQLDSINSADPVTKHPCNHGLVFWFQALPGWGQSPVIPNLMDVGKSSRLNFPRDGLSPTWTYNRRNGFPEPQFNNTGSEGYTMAAASVPASWKIARHLTWSMTIRVEAASKVALAWNNGSNDSWQLFITAGAGLRFTMGGTQVTLAAVLTDGKSHHVVCSYDGETIRGYLDGRLGITGSKTADIVYGATSVYLGRNSAADATFDFQGAISDVCLWNRALYPSEVMHRYNEWQLGYPNLLNRSGLKFGHGGVEVWDASKLCKMVENHPDRAQGRRVVAY